MDFLNGTRNGAHVLRCEPGNEGRIIAVLLEDAQGSPSRCLASHAYDANGDLVEATDIQGVYGSMHTVILRQMAHLFPVDQHIIL